MAKNRLLVFLVSGLGWLNAQGLPPVVTPRGVVNALTQQPAPSVVAPGGLISIVGLNLGPAAEAKATSVPLPKQLGEVQVLVNDRPAALYSASLDRILAQVPADTPPGLATIIVVRGDQRSRPARINVLPFSPSVLTAEGTGYGLVNSADGGVLNLSLSSLGATDPAVADGDTNAGAAPRQALRAYVGGWPAKAVTTAKPDQPGVFNVRVEVPDSALPADPVVLLQNNRASNPAVAGALLKPETQFLRLPAGTPEIRTLLTADLRASYLVATGVRAANGCFTGLLLDLAKQTSRRLPDCLASDLPNPATPFQRSVDGTALAAFVGPAKNQNEVSDQVLLLNATKPDPMTVKLPATSQTLASGPEGNMAAVLTGNQTVVIDAESGEVRPFAGNVGGGGAGGPGGPGGPGLPAVDLGDGLNRVLSAPVGVGAGTRLTVVGDNIDDPKRAKIAALNAQNAVTLTRDFPDGWLPLAAPAPQIQGPNGQVQGLPAGAVRLPVTAVYDAPQRTYYVVARRADNSRHGLVAMRTDRNEVRVVDFPEGWFTSACTPTVRFFSVELARRIGLLGASSADRTFSLDCPASGFLLLDLDEQKVSAAPLPGAGQFSATTGTNEMNDYIFGSNTDITRQGSADTLYVLDGVTGAPFRVDLPPGISGFSQLTPVPAMNLLVGLARNRQPGDAGLVVFDLDRGQGTVLPSPEGFIGVQLVDVFPATRKVVARGTRTGNTGTQLLVYDLVRGDLQIVENPAGVAFVGPLPAAAPGGFPGLPGGGGAQTPTVLLRSNIRANAVIAITYDAERRQNGVLALRIP
ncbi:MAG: hypothetical protein K2X03_19950 [Bryobacteraceae bacterium]|nr:hypothetical protein [Bryobacteraceae bacterium]